MNKSVNESQNLRDQAYLGYTKSLLDQQIRPGQFITQRELVAITGFPLGSIRELVPRLEAEGLIKTVPQRGMQVPQVDLALVRNAFQFRAFLEEPAARLFARDAPDDAIAAGGSSLRDHRRTDGELGLFQHHFRVYDREGQPCPTPGCGGTVRRVVQNGRSTFFCPACQT